MCLMQSTVLYNFNKITNTNKKKCCYKCDAHGEKIETLSKKANTCILVVVVVSNSLYLSHSDAIAWIKIRWTLVWIGNMAGNWCMCERMREIFFSKTLKNFVWLKFGLNESIFNRIRCVIFLLCAYLELPDDPYGSFYRSCHPRALHLTDFRQISS